MKPYIIDNPLIFNQTPYSNIELELIEKFNLKQYNLKKVISPKFIIYSLTNNQLFSYNVSVDSENLKDFNFNEHKYAVFFVFDLENNLPKGIIRLAVIYNSKQYYRMRKLQRVLYEN